MEMRLARIDLHPAHYDDFYQFGPICQGHDSADA